MALVCCGAQRQWVGGEGAPDCWAVASWCMSCPVTVILEFEKSQGTIALSKVYSGVLKPVCWSVAS